MPRYRVELVRVDSTAPLVEAQDEEEAVDNAFALVEQAYLCAQCSGYSQGWGFLVDEGEWALYSEAFPQSDMDDVYEDEDD